MTNLLLAFLTSFVTTFLSIPSIIRVAEVKHLFDEPDERKKHRPRTPTLGGMAIFAGLILSLTFWSNQTQILELQYIIAAILILFFLGLKDDIINLVAHKKLLGQLLAAVIIVHFAGIRLTTFYGLFGIWDLATVPSYLLSIFTIIVITNSFNLIDGIDGLAATIGIIAATSFGLWFTAMESFQFAILAFSLVGSLIGFLCFNKSPAKIFMGDTGSLILGLSISLLAIKFIEMNRVMDRGAEYKVLSVPVVTIGILIIPLFDTFRVFLIRAINKKSPFAADRNHIHHMLLDCGLSHTQAVVCLGGFNVVMIGLVCFLKGRVGGEVLLGTVGVVPGVVSFMVSKARKSR